jgi:hypothetical protein
LYYPIFSRILQDFESGGDRFIREIITLHGTHSILGGHELSLAVNASQAYRHLLKKVNQNAKLKAVMLKPQSRRLLTAEGYAAAAACSFSDEQVSFGVCCRSCVFLQ